MMHVTQSAAVVPDRITEAWRDGLDRGELLIQRCTSCGAFQHYPREHCTACASIGVEWVSASGRGVVHSFTLVRRTPNDAFQHEVPYALAIVELDEGVRMTTRIATDDLDAVRCDLPVAVRLGEDREDLPVFVPVPIHAEGVAP